MQSDPVVLVKGRSWTCDASLPKHDGENGCERRRRLGKSPSVQRDQFNSEQPVAFDHQSAAPSELVSVEPRMHHYENVAILFRRWVWRRRRYRRPLVVFFAQRDHRSDFVFYSATRTRGERGASRTSLAPLQGAMAVGTTFRWCRSAQPPANSCKPLSG